MYDKMDWSTSVQYNKLRFGFEFLYVGITRKRIWSGRAGDGTRRNEKKKKERKSV